MKLDQHWTPADMIGILAEHLRREPLPDGDVTEPFAGSGRLISALADVLPIERWHAYEIDPKYRIALEALGVDHWIGDALTRAWWGHVVTNPPFGRSLGDVLHRALGHLEAGNCVVLLGTHRAFVEKAWMPAPSEVLHPRWRPAFGGARAGLPGTCWAIWRPGHLGPTRSWYAEHPETLSQGDLL